LIEVITAVAIIGVLAALLLGTVQSARESARRVACASNLRQIGLALQSYHSTYSQFPADLVDHSAPHHTDASQVSLFVGVLPYLEQQPLFNSINHNLINQESAEAASLENRTARRTRLSVLLCPSDPVAERRVNYRFNRGSPQLKPSAANYDGPFGFGFIARDSSVTDGLSQTAFVSERVAGDFQPGRVDRTRDVKFPAERSLYSLPTEDQFISACLSTRDAGWESTSGRYWMFAGIINTFYNHAGSPNDRRPTCGWGHAYDVSSRGLHPPRSFHPGGVHVLRGDASVNFTESGIDLKAWGAMGTPNGAD